MTDEAKMPKAIAISFEEGGYWFSWPLPINPQVIWSQAGSDFIEWPLPNVFAIKFENGWIWDRIAGWRQARD